MCNSDLESEDLFSGLDHVLDVVFYPGGLRGPPRPLDQATGGGASRSSQELYLAEIESQQIIKTILQSFLNAK